MKGASDKVDDSRMARWDYSFAGDLLHPKDESRAYMLPVTYSNICEYQAKPT